MPDPGPVRAGSFTVVRTHTYTNITLAYMRVCERLFVVVAMLQLFMLAPFEAVPFPLRRLKKSIVAVADKTRFGPDRYVWRLSSSNGSKWAALAV